MSYRYQDHRAYVFTEEAQPKFLAVLAKARDCIQSGGAVMNDNLVAAAKGGDSWQLMAIVDRLVELGYLRRLDIQPEPAGQDQVYVAGYRDFP